MGKYDKFIKRINKICKAGDYTDAMYKLQDSLLADPGDGDLLWKLTDVYIKKGDDVNAVKTLGKILKYKVDTVENVVVFLQGEFRRVFPRSADSDIFLFEIFVGRLEIRSAVTSLKGQSPGVLSKLEEELISKFDKLVKVNEEKAVIRKNRKLLYRIFLIKYIQKKYDEAFEYIEKLLARDYSDKYNEIERMLDALIQLDVSGPYQNYYMGKLMLVSGKAGDSLRYFLSAVKANNSIAEHVLSLLETAPGISAATGDHGKSLAAIAFHASSFPAAVDYLREYMNTERGAGDIEYIDEFLMDIYMRSGPLPEVMLLQSEILIKKGNHEEAMKKVMQIKDRSSEKIVGTVMAMIDELSDKSDAYKVLGEYYAGCGDEDKALEYFSELFRTDGTCADYIHDRLSGTDSGKAAYLNLMGEVEVRRGDLKTAFSHYKRLMDEFPEMSDNAVAGLEKIVESSKKSLKIRILLLDIFLERKIFNKALKLVGEIIRMDPKSLANIYDRIVLIAENETDYCEKLIGLINIVLHDSPGDAYAVFTSASLNALVNNVDATMSDIRKVLASGNAELSAKAGDICDSLIERDPANGELRWTFVDMLIKNRRYADIVDQMYSVYLAYPAEASKIMKVVERVADEGYVDNGLVELYFKVAEEQNLIDDVERFIKSILTRAPEIPWTYVALAKLSYRHEDTTTVIKSIQRLIKYGSVEHLYMIRDITDSIREIARPNPGLYLILGSFYRHIREYGIMAALFDKVIGADTQNDELVSAELTSAIEEVPQDPALRILAGKLEFERVNHREAVSLFNQGMTMDPSASASLVSYFEKMSHEHRDDQFFMLELIRVYIDTERYEDAVMFISSIDIAEEYQLKYIQVLRNMTTVFPDDKFAYRRLGDHYWKTGHFGEAVGHYKKAVELGGVSDAEAILLLVEKNISETADKEAWTFFIELNLDTGKRIRAFEALEEAMDIIDPERMAGIIEKLESLGPGGDDPAFIALMCNMIMKVSGVVPAFDYIIKNASALYDEEGLLDRLLNELLEKSGNEGRIFDYYISFLYQKGDPQKIKAALAGFEKTDSDDESKARYALMYGDLCKKGGDDENAARYFDMAREYAGSIKRQLALYDEAMKINDAFWIPYLEQSGDAEAELDLAEILLRRREYRKAYAKLSASGLFGNERRRLGLLAEYYNSQKDYIGVLTVASKLNIDPLSVDTSSISIIKLFIKACRELHFYKQAVFYLSLLKGAVEETEYSALMQIIQREEALFDSDKSGNFITK